MARIQSSKRSLRAAVRLALHVRAVRDARVLPPKLPQFSDTDGSFASSSAGETMCSQTRPRSSAIDFMRSPYDSARRGSLQRSRGQTAVASSETFIRCVLANSVKMLFGMVGGDRQLVLRPGSRRP